MRVCQIGASSTTLVPKRKRRRPDRAGGRDVKETERTTRSVFMSHIPVRKGGESCSRGLHRISHCAFAMLLEVDPEVISWTTEAEPLKVTFKGRQSDFVPHFMVKRKQGLRAVLVRRGARTTGPVLDFDMTLTAAYAEHGVEYRAEFEDELRVDPRVTAAQTILWHRPWRPSEDVLARAAALAKNPPPNLGELQRVLGLDEASWPFVISLVARGWVDVGIPMSIGPETPVRACTMGASY
jgi:hypothetical protein